MICLECSCETKDGKALSNHVKRSHGMTGEDYTIKHFHSGSRPTCVACGELTRYSSLSFKRFCPSCASIAMREGGAKGGRAEAWNRNKTAESDPRIRKIADGMRGTGNPFFGHRHDDMTKMKISISKRLGNETIESRIAQRSTEFELVSSLEDYISRQRQYLQFRCRTCGTVQEKTLQSFERGSLCEQCHPLSTSQWQLEVEGWISSLDVEVKRGDRSVISPKEIDMLIPSKNVGIECHGLYFHSDAKDGNDPNAHARKADLAEKNGIKLLQIFYDEWRDRRRVVEGMIRFRLGIFERSIGARKCQIVDVSSETQRKFFESSHLAGYSPARKAWGLTYKGDLVACLSVRSPRQKKWGDRFEISRFAIAPGFNVPGGLSRLSRAALVWSLEQGKSGLMTYVDRRVGTGGGYRKAGFSQVGTTGPDYWYTDLQSRFDRFKFKAHAGKSEKQVALESKVFKIWGAGSRIMILEDK